MGGRRGHHGPAVKQLGIPLTSGDAIPWDTLTEEKAARIEQIVLGDGRLRAKLSGGPDASEGAEVAGLLFAALSQGMVMLGKMRGFGDEAASLMQLRSEQVDPLMAPAGRIIRKRLGVVSDEAFVGMGLAMAALGNFQLAQERQGALDRKAKEGGPSQAPAPATFQ